MIGRSGYLAGVGLAAALAGCTSTGGSVESIVAPPADFVVAHRTPAPGRAGVPLTNPVVVTFTANIDPSTVSSGAVSANGRSFGTIELAGSTLTFTPSGGWLPGTTYAITLSPDIRSTDGIVLGPVASWGFKTAGIPPEPDTVLAVRARPR